MVPLRPKGAIELSHLQPVQLGDWVRMDDQLAGQVRFVGSTQFADGDWVGLECQEAAGKNDGSINGTAYFRCAANHGLFVRPKRLKLAAVPTTSQVHSDSTQLVYREVAQPLEVPDKVLPPIDVDRLCQQPPAAGEAVAPARRELLGREEVTQAKAALAAAEAESRAARAAAARAEGQLAGERRSAEAALAAVAAQLRAESAAAAALREELRELRGEVAAAGDGARAARLLQAFSEMLADKHGSSEVGPDARRAAVLVQELAVLAVRIFPSAGAAPG